MSENFQRILLQELEEFFRPVRLAAESDYYRSDLLLAAGWDLSVVSGLPPAKVVSTLVAVGAAQAQISALVADPPEELDDLIPALESVADVVDAIRALSAMMDGTATAPPPHFEELPLDLLNVLAMSYLERRYLRVVSAAELLTLIERPSAAQLADPVFDATTNDALRLPQPTPRLRLDRLPKLLSDPVTHLRQAYLPAGALTTAADAKALAERLFPALVGFLKSLGASAAYGREPIVDLDFGTVGNQVVDAAMIFFVPFDPAEAQSSGIGAIVALSPPDLGDLGVVIVPFGRLKFEQSFASWVVNADVAATLEAIAYGSNGLVVLTQDGATSVTGRFAISKRASADGSALLVGSTTGTHMAVRNVELVFDFALAPSHQDFGALGALEGASVVVKGGDGDGFLQKVLPPDGLRTDFDLAIGWSNKKGLYFRGGAGLEVKLPVHASILGIVTVDVVLLALKADLQTQKILTVVAATGGIKLGPVSASVEEMGLQAELTFPQNGGNLGPAHLDKFGFKPPKGAGLSIGAGPVTGGGFLSFDPDRGQYAGGMQISFKAISLTAVGLLTTKMPDGSEGFSLLVIIVAEFPPIQLSFGFTLNGAGGLLGVNRTAKVDVLRAGIKSRTLDSILFPKDPARNSAQIVSDLSAVFPPVTGRYVFGPMAIIGWGTPTLLKIEIGVVLELPSPVRLIVMGRLTLVLPEERAALVILKMDVLGIIDFDKSDASVDATIYDSRMGYWNVTGDMAMRANWGAAPAFALSAGGFNPRFTPPPNFPALQRITIALATGDNPSVRLEAYLALTSNTVQVGAHLDVYAAVDLGKIIGTWSAQAYLGFDTLLRFSPFEFIADMRAGVSLKRNGVSKLSADLFVTLTGPEPWHAWGRAEFDFFGKREIPFEVRFGDDPPPLELPSMNPRPLLAQALRSPGNWSAQLPVGGDGLVTLGPTTLTGVLAHPFGQLTVRQTVVPLGVEIAKFGNAIPQERRFDVTVLVDSQEPSPKPDQVREYFAPAQFFELSDDEKLTRPSFEPWPAGLRFGGAGITPGPTRQVEFGYEDRVVDEEDKLTLVVLPTYVLTQEVMEDLAAASAAGFAPRAETGAAQYSGPKLGIALKPKTYALADTDTLEAVADGAPSYTEALQKKKEQTAGDPAAERQVQVVEAHEAMLA